MHEQNMRFLVEDRSGGVSEITGRPGGVIHHILGRNKPRGFKGLPEVLREWWPHVPFLCMVLTAGEHEATIKYPRMLKILLVERMYCRHGELIWEGRDYAAWLWGYFKEWL